MSILNYVIDQIDKGFSQVSFEEIACVKIVVKSYGVEKSYAKWFFIKTFSLPAKLYPFAMNPYERIKREVYFTEKNLEEGIVPRIILVDWIGKRVVKEYINASTFDLTNLVRYEFVAKLLSRIHDKGFALGDSKYSNFLVKDHELFLVDAEQAIETNNVNFMFWDLIVFLSTCMTKLIYGCHKREGLESILEAFLNRYVEQSCRAVEVMESIRNVKYRLATYTLIPYPFNIKLVSMIREIIRR